jgi:uncharacterized membrane protein
METTRMEAFSDGVFAIAITLLVLEIKVPDAANLAAGLLHLWPSYLAYAISFVVIGAIWVNHHTMFDLIVKVDQRLLLLNTALLAFVAFLPFPTAVMAEAFHERAGQDIGAAFYGATLTVIGLFVNLVWLYASRRRDLLSDAIAPEAVSTIRTRYLVGPIGYGIASLSAFLSPWIAVSLFVALNLFFLWPRQHNVTAPKV